MTRFLAKREIDGFAFVDRHFTPEVMSLLNRPIATLSLSSKEIPGVAKTHYSGAHFNF
jgi:hypothetical protein